MGKGSDEPEDLIRFAGAAAAAAFNLSEI